MNRDFNDGLQILEPVIHIHEARPFNGRMLNDG